MWSIIGYKRNDQTAVQYDAQHGNLHNEPGFLNTMFQYTNEKISIEIKITFRFLLQRRPIEQYNQN